MSDLKETIDLLINEVLGKFNLAYFKQLSRNNVRPQSKKDQMDFMYAGKSHPEIEYAVQMLPELGVGSSRRTFALSGSKALKIAKNEKGLAQNKAEMDIFQNNPGNSVVTKVFDAAPDMKWIISEIVKPFSNEEFEATFGVSAATFYIVKHIFEAGPTMEAFTQNLQKYVRHLHQLKKDGEITFKHPEGGYYKISAFIGPLTDIVKNQKFLAWFGDLVSFAKMNDLDFGDIVPTHFGRTVDGRVILYDYGLTNAVYGAHYA